MLSATTYRTTISSTNNTLSFSAGGVNLNIELLWDNFTQTLYDSLTLALSKKALGVTYLVNGTYTHPDDYMSYIATFINIPTLYAAAQADIANENSFTVIASDLTTLITALQNIDHVDIKYTQSYENIISQLQICKNAAIQENRTLVNSSFPSDTDEFLVLCNIYTVEYNEFAPILQQYKDTLHYTLKLTDGNGNVRCIILHNNVFYYSEDDSYYIFVTCSVDDIRKDNCPTIALYIGVVS